MGNHLNDIVLIKHLFLVYRILHECLCFIEFIKRVEEKRSNARLAELFIFFFFATSIIKFNKTRA